MKFKLVFLSALLWAISMLCLPAAADSVQGSGQPLPVVPSAPTHTSGKLNLETGYALDTLSNGLSNWQEWYLSGFQDFGNRSEVYGSYRETNRFNLEDQYITLGGYTPVDHDKKWTINLEGSVGPSHNVFPKWAVSGELYHDFGGGWEIFFGADHREYTATNVNIENVGLEKYWGNWRAAYTLHLSQASVAGAGGTSHSLELDNYYTDRSRIGLALSDGTEAESVGISNVQFFNVRSATLFGTHWFNPKWALTYGVGVTDQNPIYTHQHFQLGLRYSF